MSRLAVCLVCALAVVLGGCASTPAAIPTPVHRAGPALLQWGLVGLSDVPTLDPALANDATSMTIASLLYGGLVRFDSHLRVQPDGASRWTISRDGKVYTFHLRPTLRFADGRRVTAADFAWALQRALGPEGAAGTAPFYLTLIAGQGAVSRPARRAPPGIWAVNPTTLRITLTHPAAHFLAELAFPVSFVPDPSVVRRYGPGWTDHAAGFGPYSVRVWRHSRYLELVRNPYYYAGRPPLKRITFRFYGQQGDALAAYDRGAVDVISGLQAGETLSGHPAGARSVPGLALDYLAFNTTRLPFYRLHARQAFASVWTPKLVRETMAGTAFPAYSFVPSAFGIPSTTFHPTARAATYLAQARYPGGRRFPRIALVVPHDPYVHALARALRVRWRNALGLDILLRQLNPSDYSKVLNARAFDLALVRWGGDYPDPQDFLGTQLGATPDNVTGWLRPQYDRAVLLADSYSPADPRRAALFERAAGLAALKVPLLPLDEPAQTAVIRPALHGLSLTPLGTLMGNWTRVRFSS